MNRGDMGTDFIRVRVWHVDLFLGLVWCSLMAAYAHAAPAPAANPAAGAAQPAEKPAAQPAEKPAAQPADKPAVKPAEKPAVPAAKAKGAEEKKDEGPPAPETVMLDTKDNWKIHCVYYPPQEGKRPSGKAVVPIIMLHGWMGKGSEFEFLARGLQTYGYAIAVPDLRGHGRSTSWRSPEDGDYRTIKAEEKYGFAVSARDRGPHADLPAMANDVEAVKKFLVQKNNDREVNIEMLCVIGAEFGAAVALNWAVMDWSWPPTTAGKQGQDVKALILLSPKQQYPRGYRCTQTLTNPTISHQLSIMIAVGEGDREAFSDAKRIHGPLERVRPKAAADPAKQDLVLVRAPTPIQGTKLLDRNLPVNRAIVTFLDLRLARRAEDFPWGERKSPLSGQ